MSWEGAAVHHGGARRAAVARYLITHRFAVQAVLDSAIWIPALFLATLLRYDFDVADVDVLGVAVLAMLATVGHLLVGPRFGLYVYRWRYGTLDEVSAATKSILVITGVLAVANPLLVGYRLPVTAPLLAGVMAIVGALGLRFLWRMLLVRSHTPHPDAARVIVFGVGEGGHQVLTAMTTGADRPFDPVAILDDNPEVQRLRVRGVPVRGTRHDLDDVAADTGADTIVIAIPSADGELIRDLASRADAAGLKVMVLPPVQELFGSVGVADIRPLTEADLLGRREIETDLESISGYLTGRRVLVTGAGGSIGSELCRQIHQFAPERLVMLDRDESALHAVQLSIEGRALLDTPDLVVACIRDRDRIRQVFDDVRPEVVFHAAALKHLPLLEQHPAEGWKTNVWGTQNLLEAAQRVGVSTFVNISTDKAADPVSVLGETKRIAERLTSQAGLDADGQYLSVRFGNVLGSRGSVLPTFRRQIADGGPVTVTHPDVTRYFMTVPEACQLVIQAGAIGRSGETLVLDMGEPVRIADVARRLVAQSERPVEIVYTGLRPGEKLHEVLFGEDEVDARPAHPLISHVGVPALTVEEVRVADPSRRALAGAVRLRHSDLALIWTEGDWSTRSALEDGG